MQKQSIQKDMDVVMQICNLIEYSVNYSKTSGSLQQYYRDGLGAVTEKSESFKANIRTTGKAPGDANTKNVKIAVPLKYLCYFWKTLKIPVINCKINLVLTWCGDCVLSSATGEAKFEITCKTLLTQDNVKLIEQLKSSFNRTVNWNKCNSKVSTEGQNQYLDYLIDHLKMTRLDKITHRTFSSKSRNKIL